MEVKVWNQDGTEAGKTVQLKDEVFGIEPNDHVIYLDLKKYMAAQRQGTHKAKERGEIKGSTKKIKKQKGTGTARFGDIKNPLFRGGGRVFGPRPRSYFQKLNKKEGKLAKKSVLSQRLKDENLKVLSSLDFETPKTKSFIGFLEGLGINEKKSLIVLGESNKNVYLSSRNFKGASVVNSSELNIYDLLNAQEIVILESALEKIQKDLS